MNAKVLAVVLSAGLMLAACTAPTGAAAPSATPTANWPDHVAVHIYASNFSPEEITIKAGTTVAWTNRSDTMHIVAGDDGTWISDPLEKDQIYEHVFDQPGTYAYHCDVHSFMKGSIVVVP